MQGAQHGRTVLIDLLTLLKFNELQLYVEHTFAFAEHSMVWAEASPLPLRKSAGDHYCGDRFIEMVLNLNSFVISNDGFDILHKAMAECPDGLFVRTFWKRITAPPSNPTKRAWISWTIICRIPQLPIYPF